LELGFLFGVCVFEFLDCLKTALVDFKFSERPFIWKGRIFMEKRRSVTKVAVDNKCPAYLYSINVLVGCIRKLSL
jgi:hypothetical protein